MYFSVIVCTLRSPLNVIIKRFFCNNFQLLALVWQNLFPPFECYNCQKKNDFCKLHQFCKFFLITQISFYYKNKKINELKCFQYIYKFRINTKCIISCKTVWLLTHRKWAVRDSAWIVGVCIQQAICVKIQVTRWTWKQNLRRSRSGWWRK